MFPTLCRRRADRPGVLDSREVVTYWLYDGGRRDGPLRRDDLLAGDSVLVVTIRGRWYLVAA